MIIISFDQSKIRREVEKVRRKATEAAQKSLMEDMLLVGEPGGNTLHIICIGTYYVCSILTNILNLSSNTKA